MISNKTNDNKLIGGNNNSLIGLIKQLSVSGSTLVLSILRIRFIIERLQHIRYNEIDLRFLIVDLMFKDFVGGTSHRNSCCRLKIKSSLCAS